MAGRGFFLTVEGIDGVGKSTQTRLLAGRLRRLGREVVETREPGGAPGAEAIRRLLVEGDPERWSPETETLLFTAARRDHVERVLEPALARGAVVLCDRYVDSTRAYQGAGGPDQRDLVDLLHRLTIGLDPDLTLIFDLDPAAALARTRDRLTGSGEDRFERKGTAFQARLREEFLRLAAAEPARCTLIDAARPADAVAGQVWAAVAPRLGLAP
ncbi:MAG: dTMP kinase [Proteobacteria bacterium]|nr:dTMP kinase [Pseudomonadota bacterium]